ncbi:MAG: Rieske (2Fe-2S) protein [Caldilineaceae bacterium]|nr:Rieske (2Fe-2S) protein [Caldilineaceae bacterium]
MPKHVVGTVDEIPPGERKIIEVAGRSIGVFNVGGEFYALRNTCPHQGGPLCQGRLTGLLMARVPGEYSYTHRGQILRCPWHGWEFDVKTGQSWFDPVQTRVRAYPVTVETVTVETGADTADTTGAEFPEGLEKGPYIAETYDVTLENRAEKQVIVIEIP